MTAWVQGRIMRVTPDGLALFTDDAWIVHGIWVGSRPVPERTEAHVILGLWMMRHFLVGVFAVWFVWLAFGAMMWLKR